MSDIGEQQEIEKLIAEENDPKIRLQLMVMNRINLSLIANTKTINDVAEKLDAHLTKFEQHTAQEEQMINQGRGAWKVVSWVIGIVQVIGLAIWVSANEEIASIHQSIAEDQAQHAAIDKRLSLLEAK